MCSPRVRTPTDRGAAREYPAGPCSVVTATFARDDHRAAHASGHEVAVRDATLLGRCPTISSGTLLGYNRRLWRMTLRRFAVGARLMPEHYAAAGDAALVVVLPVLGVTVLFLSPLSGRAHRPLHRAVDASLMTDGREADPGDTRDRPVRPAAWAQVAAVRRLPRFGLPVFCGGRTGRMVALTFDDGPGVYTQLAVKKLRQNHLHATFFLVGKEVRAYPRLVDLEGPVAAFGDHTMTHPFLPALAPSATVWQIAAAQTLIERTIRRPVVLFRPPYEGRTVAVDREVHALGMLEVLWNVDSRDSLGDTDYLGRRAKCDRGFAAPARSS